MATTEIVASPHDQSNLPLERGGDVRVLYKELTIGEELGRGAYGVVFSGSYFGSPVAIKKLFLNVPNSLVDDFHQEVSVMRRLRHPNVVLFIGACMEPDPLCIITELGHQGSLESVLEKRKLSWQERIKFSLDIARGMNYLHHASVIHMDLKPSNVIVTDQDVCKVGDFGLSKILNYESMSVTNKGGPGTVAYTAPEVFRGDRIGTKVDVYSFGMCCWQLLLAKRPFEGMHQHAVCFNVVAQHRRPSFPKGLNIENTSFENYRAVYKQDSKFSVDQKHEHFYAGLIQQCWHRHAKQRPSFDEIIDMLEAAQNADYCNGSAPRGLQGGTFHARCVGEGERGYHSCLESTDPREWGVDEVEQWMELNDVDIDIIDVFVDNDINGKVLLSLTDDDLKNEIGITSFGKRRHLQLQISKLCEDLIKLVEEEDRCDNASSCSVTEDELDRVTELKKVRSNVASAPLSPGVMRISESGQCFIRSNGHDFKSMSFPSANDCQVCNLALEGGGTKGFGCVECGMTIHRTCSRMQWSCEEVQNSEGGVGSLTKSMSSTSLSGLDDKIVELKKRPPRRGLGGKSSSAGRLSDLKLKLDPQGQTPTGILQPLHSPSSPSGFSRFFGRFKKKGKLSSDEVFAASTSGLGKSKSSKKKKKQKKSNFANKKISKVVNEDMQEVIGRILVAISKGVPLYTEGHHQRCFEVYRASAEAIVDVFQAKNVNRNNLHGIDKSTPPSSPGITPSSLSPASAFSRDPSTRYEDVVRHFKAALRATDEDDISSYREKAWILRRAFDFVLHAEGVIAMPQTEEMFTFTDISVGRSQDDFFDEEYVAIEPTE